MFATASSLNPYPTLCPWLHVTALQFGRVSRITVEHEGVSQSFDVYDLAANFASAFQCAFKLKREMVLAQRVFDELSGNHDRPS